MVDQVPTSGPDASVTIKVSNTAELQKALSYATDGSVIELAGGDYGDLSLKNLSFSNGVEIHSANPDDPATFSSILLTNTSGLHFDSIAVKLAPDADTMFYEEAIRINTSSNISLTNSTVTGGPSVNGVDPAADTLDATGNVLGLPTGRGISIMGSSDIELANNEISQFHKGIVLYKVSDLSVIGNDIHDLRTTPLSGSGLSDILVDGNHFHDSNPWNFGGDGDHGDLIHFWTLPGYDEGPASDITITNNFLDQGESFAMLGIYLDDNRTGIGFANVTIDNNVISNDNFQAIRLENVEGSVTNNSLIQGRNSDYHNVPHVVLEDGSQVDISDNLLGGIRIDETSHDTGSGNAIISRIDPSAEGYYDNVFTMPLSEAPLLEELAVKPGSIYSGKGADLSKVGLQGTETPAEAPDGSQTDDPVPAPVDQSEETPPVSADGGENGSDDHPSSPAPPLESKTPVEKTANAGSTSVHDGGEASLLIGSEADNKYLVSHEDTRIVEKAGGGTDSVQAFVSYTLDANVENLTLKGDAQYGIGNDLDNGIKGNDLANQLEGHGGNDTLLGYGGDDDIDGGSGNDRLFGGDGNDRIDGGDGNDTLFGEDGDDLLFGGAGNDKIEGGAGSDKMFGGSGADMFIFGADDLAAKPDMIGDFSSAEGDRISLNRIDANVATHADDKFAFVGTADFSGQAGELRYDVNDGSAHVSGDWDGDGVADFSIILEGVTSLHSSDFIL